MFTGLIETTGVISDIARRDEIVLLTVGAPAIAGALGLGDSVAVSGACLTVVARDDTSFAVEMMQETVNSTKFRELRIGSQVNLERALRLDSRLDGHLVAGHVDGTATVAAIESYGRTAKYFFAADVGITGAMIAKGSVAVDGVSLTLIDVADASFSVGVIPATIFGTTLSVLKKGDIVNIETDMVGKYVIKLLSVGRADEGRPLTWDKLAEYGWI